MKLLILLFVLSLCMVAGCSNPTATLTSLNERIDALSKQAEIIESVLETPAAIDPNLNNELAITKAKIELLKEQAERIQEKADDIDWFSIAMLLLGGTGVNVFKNYTNKRITS